jgi:hypothetical protein
MRLPDVLLYVPEGHVTQVPSKAPPHPLRYFPSAHNEATCMQTEHSVAPVSISVRKQPRNNINLAHNDQLPLRYGLGGRGGGGGGGGGGGRGRGIVAGLGSMRVYIYVCSAKTNQADIC